MEPAEPGVAAYIARWRPSSVPPQAAAFARGVIGQAAPEGKERAKNLLWAAGKLADFGTGLGLDAVPEVLLHPSVAERFTPVRAGAVARGAADAAHEPAVHRPPGGAAAISGGYAAAAGTGQGALQPGGTRRVSRLGRRAAHPAAADAGGGADLPGRRRRADPRRPARRARQRRDLPLRRGDRGRPWRPAAGGAGAGPLPRPAAGRGTPCRGRAVTGGTDPGRRNITTPLIRSLSGGAGLPRLDTSRLRATWLAEAADLLGLATFMHAAGITCSQRLGDLLAALDPADEATAVALLGATR